MNSTIERLQRKVRPDGTYDLMTRLEAAEHMIKVYLDFKDLITDDLIDECVAVIESPTASAPQKRASKILLNTKYGVVTANDMIEDFAVVTERNDSLVRRWRKKVINRDGACVNCGETKGLHAHHISRWSDDPVNRINIENGITLCVNCHAEEHPALSNLIKS